MHSTDVTSSDLFSQCRGGPHNRPSSTTVWCVGISPTMVMVFTKRFSASLDPMGIPTSRLLIILWLKAHDDNTYLKYLSIPVVVFVVVVVRCIHPSSRCIGYHRWWLWNYVNSIFFDSILYILVLLVAIGPKCKPVTQLISPFQNQFFVCNLIEFSTANTSQNSMLSHASLQLKIMNSPP